MEKYLRRCVDSIIAQTYKNIQIVLVNDGSTDASSAICAEYALINDKIVVVDKENGGVSDARNTGIGYAKGVYIAFIDSDDFLHQRYIENLYNRMRRDNSDICICGFQAVDEQNFYRFSTKSEPDRFDFRMEGVYPARMVLKEISGSPMVVIWNKLYRTRLFDNIRFPVGRLHEDEFVLHRLFALCDNVSVLAERLYFYYVRSDSIMGAPYTVKRLDALDAFDDRLKFYLEIKDYKLFQYTCKIYIRWYIKIYGLLPMNIIENKHGWNVSAVKFRSHCITMFKYGGIITGIRFLLAAYCPAAYTLIKIPYQAIKRKLPCNE